MKMSVWVLQDNWLGKVLPNVDHISCTKVTTKLLKDIVLGKYCQMACITVFCILSPSEENTNFRMSYSMFSAMLLLIFILRSTTTTVTLAFTLMVPLIPVWL